ncbi:hypothetical protein BFN03_18710 [Rhodococcus sp. WMMA185]|nr:hypothetical protein BFN03_18710 [Rhodococcus sp. WMMA185]
MEHGELPCQHDDRLELSPEQFAEWVDTFADQLSEREIGPGDVIAIMLPNRAEILIIQMASEPSPEATSPHTWSTDSRQSHCRWLPLSSTRSYATRSARLTSRACAAAAASNR